MTPAPDWHPDERMLQSYVDRAAGPVLAASLESHVLACTVCRRALVPAVDGQRLNRIRAGLQDRMDAAGRPWAERLLCRLGVPESDARVLLAAPVLRRAWWLAVVTALVLAVLASVQDADGGAAFLVLAPLLPVLSTAASYAPRLDPALRLTAATPYPAIRLLLVRCGAVSVAATGLAAAGSLALPGPADEALRWLLPSAGLTAAVLALSNWMDAQLAAGLCSAGWLTAVWLAAQQSADPLAVYDPTGQLTSALLLTAAVAVLIRHRHRLDPGSPS